MNDEYMMSMDQFRKIFCSDYQANEKIRLSDITTSILHNLNSFRGCQEHTWEDVYQWVFKDQSIVYGNVNTALAGIEMLGIWVCWYYGSNFRGFVSNLHSKYKNFNEVAMLKEIWDELDSMVVDDFDMKLGKIIKYYDMPDVEKYRVFFLKAHNTFKVDVNYNCNTVPMIQYSGYDSNGNMNVRDLT